MNIDQLIAERGKPFYPFEFFPPKDSDQWPDFFEMAERLTPLGPLFMFITYGAGGSSQDATLEIASHLREGFQFEMMAHLTCAGVTQGYTPQYLQRLRDNGVDNVLVLHSDISKGRDIDWETVRFRHATDLARLAKAYYPDMDIGVAGYLALHPESPNFVSDWRYTITKIREGAGFVITQLFFDVRKYLHFADRSGDMGMSVSVVPGILSIQSLEPIRRMLSLCSANVPGKLYLAPEEANAKGGAEAVCEAGLRLAVQQIHTLLDNDALGIRLYTLNKAFICPRIAEEVDTL